MSGPPPVPAGLLTASASSAKSADTWGRRAHEAHATCTAGADSKARRGPLTGVELHHQPVGREYIKKSCGEDAGGRAPIAHDQRVPVTGQVPTGLQFFR